MKRILILLITVVLSSTVYAQEEKNVAIPIIFSQEGTMRNTSACLCIKEKVYGSEGVSWNVFKDSAQVGPERALKETIAAMKEKDSHRLKKLFYPGLTQDPKELNEQTDVYFKHLEVVQVIGVRSYMIFDNLVVFYVQLEHEGKSFFAKFPFMIDKDRNYGFLPSYNSDDLVFQLANDWFYSDWGPAKNKLPIYCKPALIEQMTHRVVLDEGIRSNLAGELLLVGSNLTGANNKIEPYASLLHQIETMKEAITSGRMDDFFNAFTEYGKEQNRDWFLNEKEEHLRRQYIENFVSQKPFYAFNADPLFIIYTRIGSSAVKVLYFVRQGKHQFRWANSAHVTTLDAIFKSRRFIEAASEKEPFSRWKINKMK